MADTHQMGFTQAKKILGKYSIRLPSSKLIRSKDDLGKLGGVGFPLAMKIISKDVIHKTDAGGVIAGIRDIREAHEAYDNILKNVKRRFPNATIEGVLAQEMATGTEVIIGMKRDEQFGPVLLFGLGGIFVEVMKDVSMRVAPITKKDALSMIDEIKGKEMLSGARGMKAADKNRIAEIVLNISGLAMKEEHIREIDLNPVFIDGKKIGIVDVRIIADD